MDNLAHSKALWPLAIYAVAVVSIVGGMIVVSYFLGQRHRGRATDEPYESGISATGTARLRFDIKFYLIAMFFVIFDVESVFVFAWTVAFNELGWTGYFAVLFFLVILIASLVYLWRVGALEWSRRAKDRSHAIE